jgi:hypothetical protein
VFVPVFLFLPVRVVMAAVDTMFVGISKNGRQYGNTDKNFHLQFHD